MRLQLKANQLAGFTPASACTATLRLPLGYCYHEIQFVTAGTTMGLAQVTEIRVTLNGKIIEQYSATQLDSMNKFKGMQAYGAARTLVLSFDRRKLENQIIKEATAIDTGKVTNNSGATEASDFFIELDCAATSSADATLNAYYTVSESEGKGIGGIRYLKRLSEAPSGANTDYQISTIPKGASELSFINAIYMYDAGIVTNAIIEKNQYKLFDRSATLNNFLQANNSAPRTAQTNWLCLDFTETGDVSSVIDLRDAQDFRLRLNVSGAGTITYWVEYMGILSK